MDKFCRNLGEYHLISESRNLNLTGECTSGCSEYDTYVYEFKVFKGSGTWPNITWTQLYLDEKSFTCKNSFKKNPNKDFIKKIKCSRHKFSLEASLFSQSTFFNVTLRVNAINIGDRNLSSISVSNMIFKVNRKPINGSCTVDSITGLAVTTSFKLNCSNWKDIDGSITKYEFYG